MPVPESEARRAGEQPAMRLVGIKDDATRAVIDGVGQVLVICVEGGDPARPRPVIGIRQLELRPGKVVSRKSSVGVVNRDLVRRRVGPIPEHQVRIVPRGAVGEARNPHPGVPGGQQCPNCEPRRWRFPDTHEFRPGASESVKRDAFQVKFLGEPQVRDVFAINVVFAKRERV